MKLCSIASGSSGNCIYAGTESSHLLIDAGISNKRIELGLRELGLKAEEVSGICITHEHSDHILGLATFMKKHPVPLYPIVEWLGAQAIPGAEELACPSVPQREAPHTVKVV